MYNIGDKLVERNWTRMTATVVSKTNTATGIVYGVANRLGWVIEVSEADMPKVYRLVRK